MLYCSVAASAIELNQREGPFTMIQSTQEHTLVATYDTHDRAEAAVKTLHAEGMDMKRLSIVGRHFQTEEHAIGFYTTGDRLRFWGGNGAFWGSLCGMLFGGAFFFIPAIGPLVVMGPLVGWIAGALEGAAVGGAVGVLGAAFASIGVPKDSIVKYEQAVKGGQFLVLARGNADMIERAHSILGASASQLAAYPAF
jgi:hypothetical protein